jgi:hypothetical protein
MPLGLPSGISPRPSPRCGSDPKKKNLLPGSGFGRVWSCLVRSTSLISASFSSPHSLLNLCLVAGYSGGFSAVPSESSAHVLALSLVAHRGHLDWEACRSGERCCCCQTVEALATPVPACMGATPALTSKPATLPRHQIALRRSHEGVRGRGSRCRAACRSVSLVSLVDFVVNILAWAGSFATCFIWVC